MGNKISIVDMYDGEKTSIYVFSNQFNNLTINSTANVVLMFSHQYIQTNLQISSHPNTKNFVSIRPSFPINPPGNISLPSRLFLHHPNNTFNSSTQINIIKPSIHQPTHSTKFSFFFIHINQQHILIFQQKKS